MMIQGPVPNITYCGDPERLPSLVEIVFDDGARRPLPARLDLLNKSPDGFAWGYLGSGPAQLALALLADWFARTSENYGFSDRLAERLFQDFKSAYIAGLHGDEAWSITGIELARLLATMVSRESEWSSLITWVSDEALSNSGAAAVDHEAAHSLAVAQIAHAFCVSEELLRKDHPSKPAE